MENYNPKLKQDTHCEDYENDGWKDIDWHYV